MNRWLIALIGIFVIVIILGGIIYVLLRLFTTPTTRVITPSPTPIIIVRTPTPTPAPLPPSPTPQPTPTPIIVPVPVPVPVPQPPNTQIYSGLGFALRYPEHWGLLTCANSFNFEFDPINNVDQLGAICNVAINPITVILGSDYTGCFGENVQIGSIPVIKGFVQTSGFYLYQWCTVTNPILKITHRVSAIPLNTASVTNHSAEVDVVISSLVFTTSIPNTQQPGY